MKCFYRSLLWRIVLVAISGAFTYLHAFPIPLHPVSHYFIKRGAYLLCYDAKHRQARWVYQHLTQESLRGEADRKDHDFQEDPLIPELFRSSSQDYRRSGYDRGHLCPAADAKSNPEVMSETFYLSNISPQIPQFNRGYWLKLEKYVRDLTKSNSALHVYTGALYLPDERSDGKRYVQYEVIGKNDVSVPTHFFKIIFAEEENGMIEAYVLPNEPISNEVALDDFKVSLEEVERVSGLLFSNFKDH